MGGKLIRSIGIERAKLRNRHDEPRLQHETADPVRERIGGAGVNVRRQGAHKIDENGLNPVKADYDPCQSGRVTGKTPSGHEKREIGDL